MKQNKLMIPLLTVCVLILAALILNLLQGGLWVISGLNGKSSYELAVENGYQGSLQEWLASLAGTDGADGKNGTDGTHGTNGKSAYEIAVENGFRGSIQEWLLSLKFGKDGQDGKDGADGDRGKDGADGKNGADGIGISSLYINKNGHLIAVLTDGSLVDAGEVGSMLPSDSGEQSDYTKAVQEGYIGTLHQWLLTFLASATDICRSSTGELLITLSDGAVKNAGKLPANGYISDTVDAEGFRPRFECVIMNREASGLNLRAAPDITAPIVTAISWGKELICIGSATVNGEEFYRFSHNGTLCYAKSKYFEKKYDSTGVGTIALPNRLVLTEGVPFRLVREELIPWADGQYVLEYRYSGRGATWETDSEASILTAPLSDTAEILNVTLWKAVEEGMLRVSSLDVEITVIPHRELPTLNGLFIGDSRFARGDLLSHLLEMNPTLQSVGTLQNTSGILCEGRGGWKAENFWISSGVGELSNPFYSADTKSFSFSHYMEKLQKDNHDAAVDFIVFYLGTNDGYSLRSVDALNSMIRSIHAYDPTLPVLVLTEYQSPARELPYAADLTRRGQLRYFQRLRDAFGSQEEHNIYLIPTHACVDTFGDRILTSNEAGTPTVSDYVHLGSLGYKRQATVLSTYLSWIFGT